MSRILGVGQVRFPLPRPMPKSLFSHPVGRRRGNVSIRAGRAMTRKHRCRPAGAVWLTPRTRSVTYPVLIAPAFVT